MLAQSRLVVGGAWLLLAAAVAYRWHSAVSDPNHILDFGAVWEAAGHLLDGGPLYRAGPYGFVYLPSTALLILPFRVLSLAHAAQLSIALTLVSMIAACALLVRRFGGPAILTPIAALLMVNSKATISGESFGNVDMYVPLLVAGFVLLIDSDVAAGAAYGLGIALKPLVVVPAILSVATRRWRLLAIALGVVAVLSLPALIVTTDLSRFYHYTIPFLISGEPTLKQSSSAINSVLHSQPEGLRLALRGLAGVVGLATSIGLWRRRETTTALCWLEVTVAGQTTFALIAGFTFNHYLALTLLLYTTLGRPGAAARRSLVLGPLILLTLPRALPVPSWNIEEQQLLALALLLAGLAAVAARSAARSTPAVPGPWTR